MKKKLFKKVDTTKSKKSESKDNSAVSTMPSYMLNICGTNVGTVRKYSEEDVGDKAIFSGGLVSSTFNEEMANVNNNKDKSFSSFLNGLFRR